MKKVVCYVCGTSYPENAAHCPICGFTRAQENIIVEPSESTTYTYVKGGRFSKANVKKRLHTNTPVPKDPTSRGKSTPKRSKKASAATIILIILLTLAIVASAGYILLRFFLPNALLFEGTDGLKRPAAAQPTEDISSDPETLPVVESADDIDTAVVCTDIVLSQSSIQITGVGTTFDLTVQLEPQNTTEVVSYSSSDSSVATVDDSGLITAVGDGSAVITVSCGTVSTECTVTCMVGSAEPETPQISLNRKEISFDEEGQSWQLYEGEVAAADIVWSSDDNNVATITEGKVTAVGNGDTTVYGMFNDQTVSCTIHCNFDGSASNEEGGISEAGGDAKRTFTLYNPTGYADDVTINVGDSFTLLLVDENKNEITSADWEVKDSDICSYKDNTVVALKSGTTEISATYDGETYTSIVRVN